MPSENRRKQILRLLQGQILNGSQLAKQLNVSRQVIVQDIALLRANGFDVISTNRGYLLGGGARAVRVFKCRHRLDELVEEAELIIGRGGRIEDVFVNHRVYGRISARLDLITRTHAEELHRSLVSGASKPLMSVTDGYHYHTVSADGEGALDDIELALRARGFLIEI